VLITVTKTFQCDTIVEDPGLSFGIVGRLRAGRINRIVKTELKLNNNNNNNNNITFRNYVSTIPGNHEVKVLQKTAILGTAHILRKVLM
jgi:hypothetical protein